MSRLLYTLTAGVLLALLAVSVGLGLGRAAPPAQAIVLNGLRDTGYTLLADDPAGDLGQPGSWPGTQWTDLTALYIAVDSTNLYVYVDLPAYSQAASSGEIGLTIDTTGDVPSSGGSGDPWGNAVTFAYTSVHYNVGETPISTTNTILPDYVIRGNIPGIGGNPPDDNNGWTELRHWDGSAWQGAGANWGGISGGGQVGAHIAYANGAGVEFAIPWADLGIAPASTVHLEFFATQKDPAPPQKGAYDTVPTDDQSATWDDPTVEHHLATYGGAGQPTVTPGGPTVTPTFTRTPGGPTPTSTPTPGGPTPTFTPTPGPGPCSGSAPGDGNILTAEVYHNSRMLSYRDPFGPIPQDGFATLRLRVCQQDVQQVQAMVWETGDPLPSPSHTYDAVVAGYDPAGPYDIWEVQVPGPTTLLDQWYQFKVTDGSRVGYYHVLTGANNSGPGAWSDGLLDLSWRLGTYLAGFQTPDWMADAVIYQIFPDRFRNGDSSNDPVPGTTKYGPVTCNGGPCVVQLHANWMDLPTTPPFGVDFFGGDLQGVIDKLDYLADLGVNTIYFNPIFEASSNHGYDTNDYYAVRAYFGDEATFDALVTAANARGIRLILDGVFNHAGSDSRYMDGYAFQYGMNKWPDLGACESASSPFRSWFESGGSAINCDGGWHWAGWYGYETIPAWLENDPVKDFFFRGGSPQSPGGIPVADYWVDNGTSGWRFDVAQDITHAWWQEMRPYVKAHDPNALMLGEVTGGCANYGDYLRGNELDGAMNYCFRDWIVSWANGNSVSAFDSAFTGFRESIPRPAVYAMMQLVDSHDSTRVLRLLNDDKNRLKLLVLLQMTLPGAPSVYYGDEVGVTGGGDPDCRRTYPWADEGGNPDLDLYGHYRQVIHLRRDHSALRGGEMETLLVEEATHLYSFIRFDAQEQVVVALNNGTSAQTAVIPLAGRIDDGTVLTDTLSGALYTVDNGQVSVPLPGQWGAILISGPTPPHGDLSNSSKEGPAEALAGDTITYTIVLSNTGDAAAATALTDTLPPSLSVVLPSLPPGMSYGSGFLYWSGSVTAGEDLDLPFQAVVDPSTPGGTVLVNNVEILGAGFRHVNTLISSLPAPDLSRSLKAAPAYALAGDTITYTIVLSNTGDAAAQTALTDTLPPSLTVVTASVPAGMSQVGGWLYWSGTVTAGTELRLPFQAVVDAAAPDGSVLINVVEILGAGFRQASTIVGNPPPSAPDLGPSSKQAPLSTVPGATITYTLVLSNSGNAAAAATLTDTLPPSLTVVTSSLPAGMSYASGRLYWSGPVTAGAELCLSFQVVVDPGAPDGLLLVNRVALDDGNGVLLERQAVTWVQTTPGPLYFIYLPVVPVTLER